MADVLVQDRIAPAWEDQLYVDNQQHLPCPASLLDFALPNGLSVKVIEPLRHTRLDYVGFDDTELHLDYRALMIPFDLNDPGMDPLAGPRVGAGWGKSFSGHYEITCHITGDLHVDQHHTTEDSAIAIGQCIVAALGDKAGIGRYGMAYSPMDEALCRVALDISGRPWLVWNAAFTQERLGEMDTELFQHWFHSIAQAAGITLHMELLYGENNHHIIEGLFKGFARAMRTAVELDPRKGTAIPSTKGLLGDGSLKG